MTASPPTKYELRPSVGEVLVYDILHHLPDLRGRLLVVLLPPPRMLTGQTGTDAARITIITAKNLPVLIIMQSKIVPS